MSRSFTVAESEIGVSGGRYKSETPGAAAVKAARMLFKELSGRSGKKPTAIHFVLRESTRGSNHEQYAYIGIKEKLENTLVIKRGDKEIKIEHVYHAKSCEA